MTIIRGIQGAKGTAREHHTPILNSLIDDRKLSREALSFIAHCMFYWDAELDILEMSKRVNQPIEEVNKIMKECVKHGYACYLKNEKEDEEFIEFVVSDSKNEIEKLKQS